MLKKQFFGFFLSLFLCLFFLGAYAHAYSIVYFCSETNCSFTVTFGGQAHTNKLYCNVIGFSGVPAGTYSYKLEGCGGSGTGSITVNGSSNYLVTVCPNTSSACCGGCGDGGAKACNACKSSVNISDAKLTLQENGNLISGTVIDQDLIGFDIFRSEKGRNDFHKLNESLRPVSGNDSIRFLDEKIENGCSYTYKLEIIDNKGTKESIIIE